MNKYILKRIGLLVLTIFVIISIVYFLLRLMPGYPKAIQEQIANAKTSSEAKGIIASYQTDQNAFIGFGKYISGIFHGDFGIYYRDTTKTIDQIFMGPFRYTLMITGPAFLIGTFFGVVFGFISGYKRGKWQDVTVNVIATFFVSVPTFVLAMFLLMFGNKVGLPISFSDAMKVNKTFLAAILPVTIISITSFATLTYYIRNEAIEVLSSDYISVARAKGLSETQIFFKHVIRNVSLPFIAIVFPSFIGIIFGSVIIEIFFSVPGSSHIFAFAITEKEGNVIMFSTVFFTTLGLLINLFVDLLYAIFDPRVTLGEKGRFSLKGIVESWIERRKKVKEVVSE